MHMPDPDLDLDQVQENLDLWIIGVRGPHPGMSLLADWIKKTQGTCLSPNINWTVT